MRKLPHLVWQAILLVLVMVTGVALFIGVISGGVALIQWGPIGWAIVLLIFVAFVTWMLWMEES